MTQLERTNGSSWQVSAISNAKWTGIKLRDLLLDAGISEEDYSGYKHIHFVGVDGMEASIPIKKAMSRDGDCLLAYAINDEPLPVQHGYPLRAIVPGHAGVRNVKWVNKIRLSKEEAHGPWQRGMAYKGFGPSVKSLEGIDVENIPSLQEQPVQSAITSPSPGSTLTAGDIHTVRGYSYSGGGRGIVRVDVSVDGGKTWQTAKLLEGSDQPLDRAWAWTFWDCDVEIPESSVGQQAEVICKATDASYNVQPDSIRGIWNLRGINNNSWHRLLLDIVKEEEEEEE
jgi:sulfite oxidase